MRCATRKVLRVLPITDHRETTTLLTQRVMKARKGGVTKSDDSGDYCTISEDIQRLEALKAQNLGLSAPPSFERSVPEWKGDRSWENLQADLLSEGERPISILSEPSPS